MFIEANEDFVVTPQMLAEAGYEPILLIRTSTTEQAENLEVQQKEVGDSMKRLGFKKFAFISVANVTGKAADRKQLQEIIDFCKATPENKRKLLVCARDVERFSRNTLNGLTVQDELRRLGVYLYIINNNLLLNGDGSEQGSNQFLFEVLLAAASNTKRSEVQASIKGTRAARKKGLFSGTPQDSYVKLVRTSGKQRGKSVYRRIYESLGGMEAGTVTVKGIARELSNSQQRMYPQKIRQIRDFLKDLIEQAGTEKAEEYLAVWDAIIKEERKRGVGPRAGSGRMTDRQRAIHRVTVAYLQNPQDFPRPDTVGNPDTATIPSPDRTGTIADASKNFLAYLPKAR